MVPQNHRDDHIIRNDENFEYRGNLPGKLVDKFMADRNRPQIMILQGFIAQGKTRTSKEIARNLAQRLREQDRGNEVHTFLFDLNKKSEEYMLRRICKVLGHNVLGWTSHIACGIDSVDDLCDAISNDRQNLVFIFIFDNVDRAEEAERSKILQFVGKLISCRDNLTMVITSRTDVNFVRMGSKVMKHQMRGMEMDDAKGLLKQASGNPKGLEEHAEKIIKMVCGSPLALMIAGNQMNERYTQLAYTPSQFVGVMTDSVSLSLDMDNVPSEDRIISRVTEIVRRNQGILQRILVALDCPQTFIPENLEGAVASQSGPPTYEGQIKRTILHVVLKRSLYTLNDDADGDNELESAPFLIEVLQEAFCHLTSKDGFLGEFHQKLLKVLDDPRPLMTAAAKDLLQAQVDLLRNHKGPGVTAMKVKELRESVINKAVKLLRAENIDKRICSKFERSCNELVSEMEIEEHSRESKQYGIQETSSDQEHIICCGDLPSGPGTGEEKEPEACLSPTTSSEISLPSIKVINKESDITKSTKTVTTESGTDHPNREGVEQIINAKKTDSDNAHQDEMVSKSSPSADITERHNAGDLSNNVEAMSLDAPSTFHTLHSNDCQRSTQESLSNVTYSALSTIPDKQILASPYQESRETSHQGEGSNSSGPTDVSRKEPVESEWIPEDEGLPVQPTESSCVDQRACSVLTKTKVEYNYSETEMQVLVGARKLQQELLDKSKATTMAAPATTRASQSHSGVADQSSEEPSGQTDLRSQTTGQGILGPVPTTRSLVYSQSCGFHPNYSPLPAQRSTYTADRGSVNSPFYPQPPPVQMGSYHQQSCNVGQNPYNQFHKEHNDDLNLSFLSSNQGFAPSLQGNVSDCRPPLGNNCPSSSIDNRSSSNRFPKTLDGYYQAGGYPNMRNSVSSSSKFRPQGPPDEYFHTQSHASSDRYSQARWPPLDSNISFARPQEPSGGYHQAPASFDRYPADHYPPLTSDSYLSSTVHPKEPPNRYFHPQIPLDRYSASPLFPPQGPSCRPPPSHGTVPTPPTHPATPSTGTPSSDRYSQACAPPLQSPANCQPQGPQSQNNPSCPHSLKSNGFYPLQGPSNAKDHIHECSSHFQHK